MQLLFVHGWSVTNTNTYGGLPEAISARVNEYELELDIQHIYLGKYISFHDEVSMDDITIAMDKALRDLPGNNETNIQIFSCITHSTGGPVVRSWIDKFYGTENLNSMPLKHLIMLAPANHGSTLAKLGKARVGRIKAWFSGVEPGQRVLDWLCLGSDGQWELNQRYLQYDYIGAKFYPFVLTGQGIDHKLYDFLNSYLVEKGSDGVVRVAGANMNYRFFYLEQDKDKIIRKQPLTYELIASSERKESQTVVLGVKNTYSHSGKDMGIMQSVRSNDTNVPIINDILNCLLVTNSDEYENRVNELDQLTKSNQELNDRYCMLVFNVRDDKGIQIGKDDYDLIILAGKQYQPGKLPKGFFIDRQMNDETGRLIYYLNADKMDEIKDKTFGFRIVARPNKGFSHYAIGEFHSNGILTESVFSANQTIYVDVKLHRFVDKNVFRFGSALDNSQDFKRIKPSNDLI